MKELALFFISIIVFFVVHIQCNAYSYLQVLLRAFLLCVGFVAIMLMLNDPNILGVLVYINGALVGTFLATILNRQSAIMGGE